MISNLKLLGYLRKSVDDLLTRGAFDNGLFFRRTQREALEAYRKYLNQDLPENELLVGFFEVPTGSGKTAVFAALTDRLHRIAATEGEEFKSIIVTPTLRLIDQTYKSLQSYTPQNEWHSWAIWRSF